MKAKEIRQLYIDFFVANDHKEIQGSSLIPENDPSVLFTTAGMHPLVPFLLGEKHPLGKRLVNYQKCLRTGDIDEVGDEIHLTFFEMLGNWSLGDYFKEESIELSYKFLVDWLKLDKDRLYVSVFKGDSDSSKDVKAYEKWKKIGIPENRIYFYGKKENWWGPAGEVGPCGPDTEIFYDSLKPKCSDTCNPSCGCGKYWEIWNNVFMQYEKTSDNNFLLLNQKNVDTGFGLERVTAIMQQKESIYDTELFANILEKIRTNAKVKDKKSERVIADHVRSACFVLSDGVTPSNIDQGYILRRLIRRTVRHMRKLEITPNLIVKFSEATINSLSDMYPELVKNKKFILDHISGEVEKFQKTLEQGEKQFNKAVSECKRLGKNSLEASTVFKLYDTFGFPPEIVSELAEENHLLIEDGFKELYEKHQEKSRQGASGKFKGGLADNTIETTRYHTATHLLHKALKIVLGEHVTQRGSNITKDRLRFDFTHNQKMTKEEVEKVEDIVNYEISKSHPIKFEEMPIEKAKSLNVIGLFENKYGSIVKVYSIGDFSIEICGGPHVSNTNELGFFSITKEQSSSAGVRRIKAILKTI